MNSQCLRGNKNISGFTLIELMATMVLMAIVMALATMALSQFNGYVDKSGKGFDARINEYLGIARLREIIVQTNDYYLKDNLNKTVLFFDGNEQGVKFVSQVGWVADSPTINWLVAEDDQFDVTLKSLVLYQSPLISTPFLEKKHFPEIEQMTRVVVLSGLQEVEFEYLGIEGFRQIYPKGTTENYLRSLNWRNSYGGELAGYLPRKVRLNIEHTENVHWPSIFPIKASNIAKRTLMLDGSS